MTTYVTTFPGLRERVRLADVIVIASGWRIEDAWHDALDDHGVRTLGHARITPERVLKGEIAGSARVTVISPEPRGAAWPAYVEDARPAVAFLQRDLGEDRYVPLYGGVFPLDGDRLLLTGDLREDPEASAGGLTLADLAALVEAEERREAESRALLLRHEPAEADPARPREVTDAAGPDAPAAGPTGDPGQDGPRHAEPGTP
ncbi:hypothetical protein [Bailinhaonella thermotolerans]|uniref:Uncharacterized protein n=1 Tax=Bailinhaonella thermotolerans TaxID=1070861 RepID=A0A3A4AU63_9ACTN|nr:hypothetical protein [Bailinhaonella thermotolerans]RJL23072.1 hypothetical protein D5H75_34455 [Bailinhaonella thermotolerans]